MYFSSPDPSAGRIQIAGTMGYSEPPSIGSLVCFLKRQCGNGKAREISTSHPMKDTRELGPCEPQLYLDIDLSYVCLAVVSHLYWTVNILNGHLNYTLISDELCLRVLCPNSFFKLSQSSSAQLTRDTKASHKGREIPWNKMYSLFLFFY